MKALRRALAWAMLYMIYAAITLIRIAYFTLDMGIGLDVKKPRPSAVEP